MKILSIFYEEKGHIHLFQAYKIAKNQNNKKSNHLSVLFLHFKDRSFVHPTHPK